MHNAGLPPPPPVVGLSGLSGLALAGANPLLTGLDAWYQLDEASGNRADSTSNARTLTDNNTVTQAAGLIGSAALFTAANSESLSRADTTFSLTGNNWTISLWAYPTDVAGGAATYGRGVACYTSGDKLGDWQMGVLPNGAVRCAHWTANGAVLTGAHTTSSTGLVADNAWHHLVFRRSGGTYTIWVNGASQAFADATTATGWTALDFRLGEIYDGSASYFHQGRLDLAGVWAARALSDSDIATLYNAGAGYNPFA